MSISEAFKDFLSNIAVDNAQVIADRYGELTRVLRFYIDTASGTGDAALRARRVRGRAAAGARVEPGAAGGHHARLWPGAARR